MGSDQIDVTATLLESTTGSPGAADKLLPLVYDNLRALAADYLRGERPGHTLQPTALVHEAYIKLVDIKRIDWKGKTHFFAMAARQMRRVLVDHARARSAQKRGAALRVTLDERRDGALSSDPTDLLALDEALGRLAEADPRQAQVAELSLFAGMKLGEIAAVVKVSERTVKNDWRFARVWIMHQLGSDPAPS